MKVIVSNIQRFCLNDGPGIRTTVFFKGCNLNCPWCSNPENIKPEIQEYIIDDESGTYGYEIELDDLEKEILKDKEYYKNGGGVTFSGGEPLLQFKKIEPLLSNLKKKNINICVETALMVPKEFIDIAINYVDEFYVDIKILDKNNIIKINGNLDVFENNVKCIINYKNVIFRIPLVKDYTYTSKNKEQILDFLKRNNIKHVEIFNVHELAQKKYESLNIKMKTFKKLKKSELEELYNEIKQLNIECKIIRIS